MPIICRSCLAIQPIAYFCVQLLAVPSYFVLSVLYICAISGTRGSSGLGSVSREQIERRTCNRLAHQNTRQSRQFAKTTQDSHCRNRHINTRTSSKGAWFDGHLRNGQGGTPLLLKNIKADASVTIDIWVENLCSESNLHKQHPIHSNVNVAMPIISEQSCLQLRNDREKDMQTESAQYRSKTYLRGLEWIIGRKMNGDQKNSSGIRTIRRTHNSSLPMEHIFCYGTCHPKTTTLDRSGIWKNYAIAHQSHTPLMDEMAPSNRWFSCKPVG